MFSNTKTQTLKVKDMGPKKVNRNQNAESDMIIEKHEAEEDDYFGILFSSISDQYSRQIYCDAILYAPDDPNNLEKLKSLKCHSLVLCSGKKLTYHIYIIN